MRWIALGISGALLLGIIFCHQVAALVTRWLRLRNAVEKEDEYED